MNLNSKRQIIRRKGRQILLIFYLEFTEKRETQGRLDSGIYMSSSTKESRFGLLGMIPCGEVTRKYKGEN